jgi:hypothetical protein
MKIRASLLFGLIGLLAAPLGCMKRAETSYPGDTLAYGTVEGGGDGSYAIDGVATGVSFAERESANAYRDDDAEYKKMEEPAAPPMEPAPEEAKPIDGKLDESKQGGEGRPDDKRGDETERARHMVYTASLQLAVYEMDEVIEFAEQIPERYGGWIQARYDYQITLRVPATRLREVTDELSTLGLVLGKTLQASDVTAEYTDLESRIAVLEQLEEQLLLLLKQAKTVEESLKVRTELERVRLELESARTRFRQLAELVGFSTLTLHLSQRGADEALPSSNDPFPWVDELGVESTEFR